MLRVLGRGCDCDFVYHECARIFLHSCLDPDAAPDALKIQHTDETVSHDEENLCKYENQQMALEGGLPMAMASQCLMSSFWLAILAEVCV